MQNQKIIIGIGGNIKSNDGSHPVIVAKKAINLLKNYSIEVTEQSSWYETEPIPKSNQPNFFNCVVFADTMLNELDVLNSLHQIEHEFGRIRKKVNEARVLDLDLIDYSNKILTNENIIIPHPRAHTRRFVMEPLAELNPNWIHPILKTSVYKILKKMKNQKIKIINNEKLN